MGASVASVPSRPDTTLVTRLMLVLEPDIRSAHSLADSDAAGDGYTHR